MYKLFLIILIAIGVTVIYDARKITKLYFSNQDQNIMVNVLKMIGFLVCTISGIILCISKVTS